MGKVPVHNPSDEADTQSVNCNYNAITGEGLENGR